MTARKKFLIKVRGRKSGFISTACRADIGEFRVGDRTFNELHIVLFYDGIGSYSLRSSGPGYAEPMGGRLTSAKFPYERDCSSEEGQRRLIDAVIADFKAGRIHPRCAEPTEQQWNSVLV